MWKKVVTPALLVCLFWLLVSGTTTYYIFWSRRSHTRIFAENVASIRAAGLMQESLWKLQAAFFDAVADEEIGNYTEFIQLEARFERSLVSAEQATSTPDQQKLVNTIRERFREYRNVVHHGLALHETNKTAPPVADQSAVMARSVAELCTELLEINERMMDESEARTAQLENSLLFVRMMFLVAGPAIGIYVGLRIARNLHHSISQISVTLKDVSGELDDEVGCVEILPVGDPGDLSRLNQQVQTISTRIHQVVSELQRARRETVRADRLAIVGELAAGVAHEMRNPLTSVKLLIQTAPRGNPGICLHEKQAHIVLQEIGRMEEIIQGLLDFARPAELHRVRHDLRETVRRALNLVDGRAAHEGVTVIPRFRETPLLVDADPEQLHQVFVNLLINGIESMQGKGMLEVTAEVSDSDARVCQVVVSDCGAGIPHEQFDRIFEPFVTTKERGTGLGLAISRRIVQEHGGLITARNRPEGGAAFTVELPLIEIQAADSRNHDARFTPRRDSRALKNRQSQERSNVEIAGD